MFAVVNKSDKLIQIHATAEPFDPTAENLFRQFAVRNMSTLTCSSYSYDWLSLHNIRTSALKGLREWRASRYLCLLRQLQVIASIVVPHARAFMSTIRTYAQFVVTLHLYVLNTLVHSHCMHFLSTCTCYNLLML